MRQKHGNCTDTAWTTAQTQHGHSKGDSQPLVVVRGVVVGVVDSDRQRGVERVLEPEAHDREVDHREPGDLTPPAAHQRQHNRKTRDAAWGMGQRMGRTQGQRSHSNTRSARRPIGDRFTYRPGGGGQWGPWGQTGRSTGQAKARPTYVDRAMFRPGAAGSGGNPRCNPRQGRSKVDEAPSGKGREADV